MTSLPKRPRQYAQEIMEKPFDQWKILLTKVPDELRSIVRTYLVIYYERKRYEHRRSSSSTGNQREL